MGIHGGSLQDLTACALLHDNALTQYLQEKFHGASDMKHTAYAESGDMLVFLFDAAGSIAKKPSGNTFAERHTAAFRIKQPYRSARYAARIPPPIRTGS